MGLSFYIRLSSLFTPINFLEVNPSALSTPISLPKSADLLITSLRKFFLLINFNITNEINKTREEYALIASNLTSINPEISTKKSGFEFFH